jgi:hypothetical protein
MIVQAANCTAAVRGESKSYPKEHRKCGLPSVNSGETFIENTGNSFRKKTTTDAAVFFTIKLSSPTKKLKECAEVVLYVRFWKMYRIQSLRFVCFSHIQGLSDQY